MSLNESTDTFTCACIQQVPSYDVKSSQFTCIALLTTDVAKQLDRKLKASNMSKFDP